jgi:hypothetical protein
VNGMPLTHSRALLKSVVPSFPQEGNPALGPAQVNCARPLLLDEFDATQQRLFPV